MKLKNLFLGSFALTAMLFAQSCEDKNDGPTGAPSIELSKQTLDFEKDGGSQTIKLTATRDWNVTNVPDWIDVDPKSGNPAENKEVTVTVLENTGMDRSQEIKFTIGFDGKTLTVNQKGTGSASYTSIKDVREKGSGATLGENTVVCGVVISSKELNNFTSGKILVLQDETAGIELFLSAKHSFARGDKVVADLSGASLSEYQGLLQINGIDLGKVTKISSGNAVEAKKVNIDDFMANKYESQYVAISDVQVSESDLSKKWYYGTQSGANITLVTKDGKNIIVRSGQYSSFKGQTVPQGSGEIKGIAAIFGSDMQLIFSDASDWSGLTGARFTVEAGPAKDMTIAEAVAAAANTVVNLNGLVTGAYKNGFMLTDNTGSILIFEKDKCSAKVGDKVKVAGTKAVYSNLPQIASSDAQALAIEVISSGNEVTYPEAKVLDGAAFDGYSAKTNEYISYTGTVVKSNNYYNIEVAGATARKGSLQYIPDSFGAEALIGKQVVVTGYFTGLAASSTIVNTMVTSLNESSASYLSVSPLSISAKAGDTSASFDVKGNVKWTVSSENAAYTVSPASGEGAGTVTVKFAANETEKDVTVKLTVSTTADVATKSYTVTLTHKGKSAAGAEDFSSSVKWTPGTNAYSEKATINDVKDVPVLKLGTSKKAGSATLKIPAGTTKVSFYGVAWKGNNATIKASVGETQVATQKLVANIGATSSSPYTLTVEDTDKYTITLPAKLEADTDVTVTTTTNARAILFAIKAEK
ncbi:MAG: DUF5689 domain-containing protein [Candidatus Cryptobacteroides sp.]|nr:DUF5689 domain-containing protein [Candidatus Cryptobacteroides sp.]